MDRDSSYYTPDGDIAYLRVARHGAASARAASRGGSAITTRAAPWSGVEVWEAYGRLPRELITALPRLEGHGAPIERQPA